MMGRILGLLRGIAAMLFITCITILVWIPLALWILQWPFTRGASRARLRKRMDKIILWWTGGNRWMYRTLHMSEVEVRWHNREDMSDQHWYMVVSNHQSWTDIVLLQSHLYGTIPPLKFFTKQQLIWVPGIGPAMYFLGFPYVKRATREQIRANPKLRSADRDNTLKACEGFKNHPTSILNFLEGTRNNPDKHAAQKSAYKHLLSPKIGGMGYVLTGMQDHLACLIDVTIIYPDGVPSFWGYLRGECARVIIDVRPRPIPEQLTASDDGESNQRAFLSQWVREIWEEKDQLIASETSTSEPVTG